MLLGHDAYNSFIEYVENNIDFEFLSHIPGYDKNYEVQRESIIKLIKKSNNNESFIDYVSYTYQTLKSNIINKIVSVRLKNENGEEYSFINDDKFNLTNDELINYLSVLLILKDIMHTSYIAYLPIYNEYKYDVKEFRDKAKEMIDNSIDNISTLENINPIFIAIAAKSILPYSIKNDELSSSSRLIAILFNISRIISSYPYTEDNILYTQPIFVSAIYNLVNNASFLGLDYNMIKKLYDIVKTGEIEWKN